MHLRKKSAAERLYDTATLRMIYPQGIACSIFPIFRSQDSQAKMTRTFSVQVYTLDPREQKMVIREIQRHYTAVAG